MRGTPGIAAIVFGALGAVGINVTAISQGSSERNISLVVDDADASRAVRALHAAFRLEGG
jgi:aspartokinase